MTKQVRSWSNDGTPNLIGRKKVDWSIFESGTQIPNEFYEDFYAANNESLDVGDSHEVTFIVQDTRFQGKLEQIQRSQDSTQSNLQIRYTDKVFKELLINTFRASYESIISLRNQTEERKKSYIQVPDEIAEYIEFYATGMPYNYELKFIVYNERVKADDDLPSVWWVNQGISFSGEIEEGILWAPLANSAGRSFFHWNTMDEVKVGDIIVHYAQGYVRCVSKVIAEAVPAPKPDAKTSDNWEENGRLIRVQYNQLDPSISLKLFAEDLQRIRIFQGPINKNGAVQLGYLFRFSIEGLAIIQSKSQNSNWPDYTKFSNSFISGLFEEEKVVDDTDIKSQIDEIKLYIAARGFSYPGHLIENFYLSLKTKPFVILAGISGTGKTKLVKLFAEALGATEQNNQFALIPVRPDWSDPSDLIGYQDLAGKFRPGPLTKVLLEAMQPGNRNKPYFICLDEMNLARVEHYFSDMLSILETQRRDGDRIVTDTIVSEEQLLTGTYEEDLIISNLVIPDNVFLIGTVNMDETTHPFSKKVLDRANTLEFNYIRLDDFPMGRSDDSQQEQSEIVPVSFLKSDYLALQDAFTEYQPLVRSTTEKLVKVNEILEELHAHVGFRVRDAICFYMIYNDRFQLLDEEAAFDTQLLQKILPRIQGSSQSVKRVLISLLHFCNGKSKGNMDDLLMDASELYKPWRSYSETPEARYPQSARKLAYMLRRLEEDGFTSFWLS
ncbi:hypothetical protein PCCS19_15820 [Paenibacillus sp. CCS19]|uniref:McrB family protein n=1 Tax=Paenibacillus sp. CCS19 TaxID=3158387 RepID=UPI00256A82BC|nr:AAA family ATPase [Paenibacillus cellulosilyticus]GMK38528.1 hypothetical protein PCCS19_15820 [Paenibacillus cellulosilyticus]